MHPLPGLNRLLRLADDLAILTDVICLFAGANSKLVTQTHWFGQLHGSARDFQRVAGGQVPGGDADIVVGVQVNGVGNWAVGSSRHGQQL